MSSLKGKFRFSSFEMNRVNINESQFFIPGLTITGKLKTIPEDFIVKELKYLQDDVKFDANIPDTIEFCELPLTIGIKLGCGDTGASQEDTEKLIAEYITPEMTQELATTNGWLDRSFYESSDFIIVDPLRDNEMGLSASVAVRMPVERKDRVVIHQYVRQSFPFLHSSNSRSVAESADGLNIEDAQFCPDTSLFKLLRYRWRISTPALSSVPVAASDWRTYLSREDIKALYRFLKLGPAHADAFKGVTIGGAVRSGTDTVVGAEAGLTKDGTDADGSVIADAAPESESYLDRGTRTILYKSLTSQFPCWGIKTLGDVGPAHAQHQQRSNKQFQKKRKREGNDKNSEDPAVSASVRAISKPVSVFWKTKTVSQAQIKDDKRALNTTSAGIEHTTADVQSVETTANGTETETETRQNNRLWRINLTEIRPITLYVECMLYKYDTEQFAAVKQLTDVLRPDSCRGFNVRISPHQIHFAGTKDKAAATYQHLTITVLLDSDYLRKHVSEIMSTSHYKDNSDGVNVVAQHNRYPPIYTIAQNTIDTVLHKLRAINSWCGNGKSVVLSDSSMASNGDDLQLFHSIESNAPLVSLNTPGALTEHWQSRRPQIAVGNVRIVKKSIQLGDLWGNSFRIVLRNLRIQGQDHDPAAVSMDNCLVADLLQRRMSLLCRYGYPNYFGSQRMGSSGSSTENVQKLSGPSHSKVDLSSGETYEAVGENGSVGEASADFPSITMPVGPHVGLSVLQGRYKDAVDSVIMSRACSINRAAVGSEALPATIGVPADVHDLFLSLSFVPISTVLISKEASVSTLCQLTSSVSLQQARQLYHHYHHYRYVGKSSSTMKNQENTSESSLEICGRRSLVSVLLEMMPATASRERTLLKGLLRYVFVSSSESKGGSVSQNDNSTSNCVASGSYACEYDYELAFNCIPFNMRNLYQSAYQSWIWNKAASFCLHQRGDMSTNTGEKDGVSADISEASLFSPMTGDLMLAAAYEQARGVRRSASADLRVRILSAEDVSAFTNGNNGISTDSDRNHDPDKTLSENSKPVHAIVLPLPGKSIVYPDNEVGAYMKQLLRDDGFDVDSEMVAPTVPVPDGATDSVTMKAGPHESKPLVVLKCSGGYRNVLQCVSGEVICMPTVVDDVDAPSSLDAEVRIRIPAGSFATAFLREFMCNNDLI